MYRSTSLPLTLATMALSATTAMCADTYNDWHFGNMFAFGPTSENVHITKATYSLVPPAVPCGYGTNTSEPPWLSLWVGVSDSINDQKADLFQPLLNWSPDQESQYVFIPLFGVKWLLTGVGAARRVMMSGVSLRAPITPVCLMFFVLVVKANRE